MDLLEGDVELTEFEAIDVQSIKGVGQGANGFPILMMKGLTSAAPEPDAPAAEAPEPAVDIAVKAVTGGKVDQGPDIDLGHQIMGLLAQAIQNEAQEIGAGSYGETCDVDLLNCAASMISRWVGREAAPGEDDDSAMMLMQSAARALGVPGPLGDDAGKSRIAPEETTVDTETQTGDLTEVVKAAVAEANASLVKEIADLRAARDLDRAELAKVKATPVPGGPVLSRNVQVKQPGAVVNEDYAAKAAHYRDQASLWDSQDRATADGYRLKAREAEAKAVTPTS